MLRSESGLEAFKEIIGGEVGSELRGYSTFQDFGQEGGFGDGAEVTWIVSVETRFFDDGCYGSQFEGLGNRTGAEEGVNDVGDEWGDDREAVLNEFGWDGVQGAGGGFYPCHESF